MKKLLIPIILLLFGTGSGVGAAFLLKPPADEMAQAPAEGCLPVEHVTADVPSSHGEDEAVSLEVEYAKLNNQFVVPIIEDEKIAAMVVVSLSVEVPAGSQDKVFGAEPKLRDAFLQVMFNHANIGGFSGNFTAASNMRVLREDLLKSARATIGDTARDILVMDIVRQDI